MASTSKSSTNWASVGGPVAEDMKGQILRNPLKTDHKILELDSSKLPANAKILDDSEVLKLLEEFKEQEQELLATKKLHAQLAPLALVQVDKSWTITVPNKYLEGKSMGARILIKIANHLKCKIMCADEFPEDLKLELLERFLVNLDLAVADVLPLETVEDHTDPVLFALICCRFKLMFTSMPNIGTGYQRKNHYLFENEAVTYQKRVETTKKKSSKRTEKKTEMIAQKQLSLLQSLNFGDVDANHYIPQFGRDLMRIVKNVNLSYTIVKHYFKQLYLQPSEIVKNDTIIDIYVVNGKTEQNVKKLAIPSSSHLIPTPMYDVIKSILRYSWNEESYRNHHHDYFDMIMTDRSYSSVIQKITAINESRRVLLMNVRRIEKNILSTARELDEKNKRLRKRDVPMEVKLTTYAKMKFNSPEGVAESFSILSSEYKALYSLANVGVKDSYKDLETRVAKAVNQQMEAIANKRSFTCELTDSATNDRIRYAQEHIVYQFNQSMARVRTACQINIFTAEFGGNLEDLLILLLYKSRTSFCPHTTDKTFQQRYWAYNTVVEDASYPTYVNSFTAVMAHIDKRRELVKKNGHLDEIFAEILAWCGTELRKSLLKKPIELAEQNLQPVLR